MDAIKLRSILREEITNGLISVKDELKLFIKEEIKTEIHKSLIPIKDELKIFIKEEISNSIEPIKKDITALKTDMILLQKELKELKNLTGNIIDYIKKDIDAIENEIGPIIKNHYLATRKGNVHFKKYPTKQIHTIQGQILTDLDYAIVAYNQEEQFYQLIIVEAKHHISQSKINKKLEQVYKIKKLFDGLKHTSLDSNISKLFIRDMNALKKENLDIQMFDPQILFYIGGPTWEDNSVTYLQNLYNGKAKKLIFKHKQDKISLSKENEKELLMYVTGNIGLIIPQGDRYKIFDATSLSAIAGGNADNNACKYDTTFKMKIMPNYMNIIYT